MSSIEIITCKKCGYKLGYIDIDYFEKTKTTGCDECGYKKVEKLK